MLCVCTWRDRPSGKPCVKVKVTWTLRRQMHPHYNLGLTTRNRGSGTGLSPGPFAHVWVCPSLGHPASFAVPVPLTWSPEDPQTKALSQPLTSVLTTLEQQVSDLKVSTSGWCSHTKPRPCMFTNLVDCPTPILFACWPSFPHVIVPAPSARRHLAASRGAVGLLASSSNDGTFSTRFKIT